MRGWPDGCDHQRSVERSIEQLFAVSGPAREVAPATGNSPFGTARWEARDVDFVEASGFVRRIGNPFVVRRNFSLQFIKCSFLERLRYAIPAQGKEPQLRSAVGALLRVNQIV